MCRLIHHIDLCMNCGMACSEVIRAAMEMCTARRHGGYCLPSGNTCIEKWRVRAIGANEGPWPPCYNCLWLQVTIAKFVPKVRRKASDVAKGEWSGPGKAKAKL